jgi:acetyl-CoA carboxylase carboxyl transferase subunit beta
MALENLFGLVKDRWNGITGNNPPAEKPKNEPAPAEIPAAPGFKCPRCLTVTPTDVFAAGMKVCPNCNYHSRISADERIEMFTDKGSFTEFDVTMKSLNPIDFPGYEEKQRELAERLKMNDGMVTGLCTLRGEKIVLGVMDSRFMMASMGSVAGEKITRAFEYATREGLPVIMFTASGGARMQEGIISLMQMAKTSAAAKRHSDAGLLFISIMTDPTTGGVEASFASLGDIIIAEPKVLIGFAGRRVIEGTIKQRLPDDFQSAEFQLAHGFIDMICERRFLRRTVAHLIKLHK